jgi:hypothetical protein
MIGQDGEAGKVMAAIAKQLKIGRSSPCFCGSGKKWKNCCGLHPDQDPIFLEAALKTARAYKKSQGIITALPVGIWRAFERASLNRFKCLYPGCPEKPVNCHLVPENVLRSYYGGHCKEYGMQDTLGLNFVRTGIREAGGLPVFCNHHDNDLFKKIDQLQIPPGTKEQYFLFALKASAFSLRKCQYLLGIDSQVEIIRPFLIQEELHPATGSHFTIDISHLQEQYTRFVANLDFYKSAIDAYLSQSWDDYLTLHRILPSTTPIFGGALLNPSQDLKLRKINSSSEAIMMGCSIFTAQDGTHILLSCPKGASQNLYREFLQQLELADEQIFVTVINNFLTIYPDTLLMPDTFTVTESDAKKITVARQLANSALQGHTIFDLRDPNTAVKFIQ